MPTARTPITIIGAGLSALPLARCLAARNIPFTLHDKSSSPPRNDYGITLLPSAFRPFLRAVNIPESSFRAAVAIDTSTHATAASDLSTAPDPDTPLRAHRARLEAFLRADLPIQQSHALASAIPLPSGTGLRLTFADDTTHDSPLTVAADGEHSTLRAALAPSTRPTILAYAAYHGKRTIPIADYDALYRPLFTDPSTNLASTHAGPARLQLETISVDRDAGEATIRYTYSRPAHTTSSSSDQDTDPLFTPNRSKDAAKQVPAALYTEIAALPLSTLPPAYAHAFDPTTLRTLRQLNWLMRSFALPRGAAGALLAHGVVAIGAAAHTEPILGGYGANGALVDAVALADALTDARPGEEREALGKYVETRREAWGKGSEEAGVRIAELHGEGGGRSSL